MKLSHFPVRDHCFLAITLAAVAQAANIPQLHRRDGNQSLSSPLLIKSRRLQLENNLYNTTIQCAKNKVITELWCAGKNCEAIHLGCREMYDDLNDGNYTAVGDTIITRETSDTYPPAYCPPNTAATYWDCDGKNCDVITMGCQAFEKQYRNGSSAPVTFPYDANNTCTWADPAKSSKTGASICPDGKFLRGLAAFGSHSDSLHSDSLRMLCCPASLGKPSSDSSDKPQSRLKDGEAVKCTKDGNGKCKSKWKCMIGSLRLSTVNIWWGHTANDATWACNNWNSDCGNAAGGCKAELYLDR